MIVHFGRKCRPSAVALSRALNEEGYEGRNINFGIVSGEHGAINRPHAIANAVNKRRMRQIFRDNEVPMPRLLDLDNAGDWNYPVVGRPDQHRKGRGFWLCRTPYGVAKATRGRKRKKAATHFMEFIEAEREFRVHVVAGQSIKISEKIGGDGTAKNHARGAYFQYPQDFSHKKTLRRAAKQAVEALELDFGAVDILWANDKPYVLEVNTAPCLTDENSDTLERYVSAFIDNFHSNYEYEDEEDDYDDDWYDD